MCEQFEVIDMCEQFEVIDMWEQFGVIGMCEQFEMIDIWFSTTGTSACQWLTSHQATESLKNVALDSVVASI